MIIAMSAAFGQSFKSRFPAPTLSWDTNRQCKSTKIRLKNFKDQSQWLARHEGWAHHRLHAIQKWTNSCYCQILAWNGLSDELTILMSIGFTLFWNWQPSSLSIMEEMNFQSSAMPEVVSEEFQWKLTSNPTQTSQSDVGWYFIILKKTKIKTNRTHNPHLPLTSCCSHLKQKNQYKEYFLIMVWSWSSCFSHHHRSCTLNNEQ